MESIVDFPAIYNWTNRFKTIGIDNNSCISNSLPDRIQIPIFIQYQIGNNSNSQIGLEWGFINVDDLWKTIQQAHMISYK